MKIDHDVKSKSKNDDEESRYSRSWYEALIRKKLLECKVPYKTLGRWASDVFFVVELVPYVFGYVIPLKVIAHIAKEKYCFVIYTKNRMNRYLFVSDVLFNSRLEAVEKLQYYLRYFPYYCLLSRNIFKHPDISLYK